MSRLTSRKMSCKIKEKNRMSFERNVDRQTANRPISKRAIPISSLILSNTIFTSLCQ